MHVELSLPSRGDVPGRRQRGFVGSWVRQGCSGERASVDGRCRRRAILRSWRDARFHVETHGTDSIVPIVSGRPALRLRHPSCAAVSTCSPQPLRAEWTSRRRAARLRERRDCARAAHAGDGHAGSTRGRVAAAVKFTVSITVLPRFLLPGRHLFSFAEERVVGHIQVTHLKHPPAPGLRSTPTSCLATEDTGVPSPSSRLTQCGLQQITVPPVPAPHPQVPAPDH